MENTNATTNLYEPKRKNRFIVELPEEMNIESFLVKKVKRPKYSVKENSWDDMLITFIDPVVPSTSMRIFNLLKSDFFQKKKPTNRFIDDVLDNQEKPIFIFHIKSLDPTGIIVEDWEITVKEVIHIDFEESNYNNNELQTISMLIKPLTCHLLF